MKFFNVLLFSAFALASPAAVEPRTNSPTVVGTIRDSVSTLKTGISGNLYAIESAVDSVVQNGGEATEEIIAIIKENLEDILEDLKDATDKIVAVTTGAVGGVIGGVLYLTQAQIDLLVEAVGEVIEALKAISATLTITITNLGPDAIKLIKKELEAVEEALAPFIKPLAAFINAALKFTATIGVTLTGLKVVQKALSDTIGDIVASLGIKSLGDLLKDLLTILHRKL